MNMDDIMKKLDQVEKVKKIELPIDDFEDEEPKDLNYDIMENLDQVEKAKETELPIDEPKKEKEVLT